MKPVSGSVVVEITKSDYVKGGIGLVTGGPLGAVLSPIVGRDWLKMR